ncbi:hypothetical protein PQ077_01790 [Litorivicinus sp.]|nr:hypothetical protein [Litorivicinus sp.]
MMFFKKSKPLKHAIKISIDIALHEIPHWLESDEETVKLTEYEHDRDWDLNYEIVIFPQADEKVLYWHKTAGDLCESIRSWIELEGCYRDSINWTELCPTYGSPILEIQWWRDQVLVTFDCKRLIAFPMQEAVALIATGSTTNCSYDFEKKVIQIPKAYDSFHDNANVIEWESLSEKLSGNWVMYENQLAKVSIEVAPQGTHFRPERPLNNRL